MKGNAGLAADLKRGSGSCRGEVGGKTVFVTVQAGYAPLLH